MKIRSDNATGLQRAMSASQTAGVDKGSRYSEDFRSWLNTHGYGGYDFAKGNLPSFGGKSGPGDKPVNEPVIFIHGNGGSAADWDTSVRTFKSQGYKDSELYGMTWGPNDIKRVGEATHSKKYLSEVRAFIQAVKEYTGAEKVDVIGHSMGVTLSRKAIQGGTGTASDGSYDLGKPLTHDVDTFVGVAGANRGLTSAYLFPIAPTTNALDGFYPGVATPFGVVGQSKILQDINQTPHDEGQHVYSIWSPADEIVNAGAPLGGGLVYGEPTSRIPGQDGEKVYAFKGHFQLKDDTAEEQLRMVRDHKV